MKPRTGTNMGPETTLRIVFRADASLVIGTGHVMRCLALADVLNARGATSHFVCRDLPGGLADRIAMKGFEVTVLPAPDADFSVSDGDPAHADWAGVTWKMDALETREACGKPDWLVVDHYSFDARWHSLARPAGAKVLVVDDLADRPIDCNLLLNQNLGRRNAAYDGLMTRGVERLVGPRYALLRQEFPAARDLSLTARARRGYSARHVLVTMGGIDLPNATEKVLDALTLVQGIRVTVLLGANAPAVNQIKAQAIGMPFPCEVLVDPPEIASLMTKADLAIGAGGTMSLERCALGLPTLVAVLADNQREGARSLAANHAAMDLGSVHATEFTSRLEAALRQVCLPGVLQGLSERASRIVDGRGAARVADAMQMPLKLRPATMEDAKPVWNWRKQIPVKHMVAGQTPSFDQHIDWFAHALSSDQFNLYMAGSPPFAHLRLDRISNEEAELGIVLSPEAQGKNLSVRLHKLLNEEARAQEYRTISARMHGTNAPALSMAHSLGYAVVGASDGFKLLRLEL